MTTITKEYTVKSTVYSFFHKFTYIDVVYKKEFEYKKKNYTVELTFSCHKNPLSNETQQSLYMQKNIKFYYKNDQICSLSDKENVYLNIKHKKLSKKDCSKIMDSFFVYGKSHTYCGEVLPINFVNKMCYNMIRNITCKELQLAMLRVRGM